MSLKSELLAFASQRMPKLSRRVLASAGYTLDPTDLAPDEEYVVWTSDTAQRQDRAWQALVEEAKAGRPREDVVALYDALDWVGAASQMLEVGCGGGYYSELVHHRHPQLEYRGVDIAPAMIELARKHYPGRAFEVGNAYDLAYGDSSHDVVVDGVALIHMSEWPRALSEYARVARTHVILHGVTITDTHPTTMFAKYAYGQPSHEYVFARAEMDAVCASAGLRRTDVLGGLDYDLGPFLGIPSVSETWVLAK